MNNLLTSTPAMATCLSDLLRDSNLRAASWYSELSQLFQDSPGLEDDIGALLSRALKLPFPLRKRFIDPYLSLNLGCPCLLSVLLRSISDSRDWSTCILEKELKVSKDKLDNMDKHVADMERRFVRIDGGVTDYAAEEIPRLERNVKCLSKILDLVPADQSLWRDFSAAARNIKELISEQRTKYTPEMVRENFKVLYIGHSNVHHRDSIKRLEDFLVDYDWFDVDPAQQPLFNDVGNFHQDDVLENLLEISVDKVQEILPTNHFNAIILVHCPAVLRTQSFNNLEALLRPGGFLVACPPNVSPTSDVPSALKPKLAFEDEIKFIDGACYGRYKDCSWEVGEDGRKISGRVWHKQDSAALDRGLGEGSESSSKKQRVK